MFSKIKKPLYLILIIFIISINVGCNKTKESSVYGINSIEEDLYVNEENDDQYDMNIMISVDDFMELYNISESEVPRDYVESYIMEYRLPNTLEQDDVDKVWGDKVVLAYKTGKPMGETLGSLFNGTQSDLHLDEYINNADIIAINFNMRFGNERYEDNCMVIDLKNKMIYFTRTNSEKYKDFELKAELSDDEVQQIRDELSKHIVEEGSGTYGVSDEYSFIIKMKANDYSTKMFSGDYGDETHFPGFDEYWKSLYREYFGEEYAFDFQ